MVTIKTRSGSAYETLWKLFKNDFEPERGYPMRIPLIGNHVTLDNTLIYSVFLDKHLSFVSLCRDFEHLFFFNMRMFEILNINFCEFFGLNQTSLYNHLRKDENEEKKASFIEEDKALSIFTIVSPKKICVMTMFSAIRTCDRLRFDVLSCILS